MSLYKRTDKLPRYWRINPKRMELSDFSYAFDGWYFGEAGGLFLSDKARDAYHSLLEVMATVASEGPEEDQLSDEDTERLWRAGQALRWRLAADIGAAEDPRLSGRLPAPSPAATVRMKDRQDGQGDDCSPSLPGSSGNGALANVGFDQDLRNNVPSVFRQSPEDSERRSSPAIGSLRGQACNHEHKS